MAGSVRELAGEALGDGSRAWEYLLDNGRGLTALIGTLGARLTSLRLARPGAPPVELVLGHARLRDYLEDDGYLGATIGRFANRIARGRFTLDGESFQVPPNNGPNALHGGPRGFDQALWRAMPEPGAALRLAHHSPDGDQGFPGAVEVGLRVRLTGPATLALEYEASTTRPTVVNLTNHSYFNLAGEGSGDILGHWLTIAADRFTPVDGTLIPTGELREVAGTPFDFRAPHRIGERIGAGDEQLWHAGGYDHNFVLSEPPGPDGLRFAARLRAPDGGLALEVWTSEPGLQFYSGNFLRGAWRGRDGVPHGYRMGLCLETQHFPDSPNQPHFPDTVLRPGQVFRSRTEYRLIP